MIQYSVSIYCQITESWFIFFSKSFVWSYIKAIPPVIPAAKLSPTFPSITTVPPVIYSQPLESHPSTTVIAPEFLTENLSPAWPAAKSFPDVAPYKTVFPMIVFSLDTKLLSSVSLIVIMPPDKPFPT